MINSNFNYVSSWQEDPYGTIEVIQKNVEILTFNTDKKEYRRNEIIYFDFSIINYLSEDVEIQYQLDIFFLADDAFYTVIVDKAFLNKNSINDITLEYKIPNDYDLGTYYFLLSISDGVDQGYVDQKDELITLYDPYTSYIEVFGVLGKTIIHIHTQPYAVDYSLVSYNDYVLLLKMCKFVAIAPYKPDELIDFLVSLRDWGVHFLRDVGLLKDEPFDLTIIKINDYIGYSVQSSPADVTDTLLRNALATIIVERILEVTNAKELKLVLPDLDLGNFVLTSGLSNLPNQYYSQYELPIRIFPEWIIPPPSSIKRGDTMHLVIKIKNPLTNEPIKGASAKICMSLAGYQVTSSTYPMAEGENGEYHLYYYIPQHFKPGFYNLYIIIQKYSTQDDVGLFGVSDVKSILIEEEQTPVTISYVNINEHVNKGYLNIDVKYNVLVNKYHPYDVVIKIVEEEPGLFGKTYKTIYETNGKIGENTLQVNIETSELGEGEHILLAKVEVTWFPLEQTMMRSITQLSNPIIVDLEKFIERTFSVDHSSFNSWVPGLLGLDRLAFNLDYTNMLDEDVQVVFFLKDSNGNIQYATTDHRLGILGYDSVAETETSGSVYAETESLRPGLYRSAWKAYRLSDTLLSESVDGSSYSEEKQFEFRITQGMDAITHSLLNFKETEVIDFWSNYRVRTYRYSVDSGADNVLTINYYDEWPTILAPILPSKYHRIRHLYIFIPEEIEVNNHQILQIDSTKSNFEKSYVSSYNSFEGTWYIFSVEADTENLFYYKWNSRIRFNIENPSDIVSPLFIKSSSMEEIISNNILDEVVQKFYSYIASKITGGSWFSWEDLVFFLGSIPLDYYASNQIVALDALSPGALRLSVISDKNEYVVGQEAVFQVKISDETGVSIDPSIITALHNGKGVSLYRLAVGDYEYWSHPLAEGSHSFQVIISKPGYEDAKYEVNIFVKQSDDKNIVDAIEDKQISASLTLQKEEPIVKEVFNPDINVEVELLEEKLIVKLNSESEQGTSIIINVDDRAIPSNDLDKIIVFYDGQRINKADDYKDILNIYDDTSPEFYLLMGQTSTQIYVSVPQFSFHEIEVCRAGQTEVSISGASSYCQTKIFLDDVYLSDLKHDEYEMVEYEYNTIHTISVEQILSENSEVRYVCIDNRQNTTADNNVDFAYFKQYLVRINSEYGNPLGAGWYYEDNETTISVEREVPFEGLLGKLGARNMFTGWSGDVNVQNNIAKITVNEPKTLVALWREDYTYIYFEMAVFVILLFMFAIRKLS